MTNLVPTCNWQDLHGIRLEIGLCGTVALGASAAYLFYPEKTEANSPFGLHAILYRRQFCVLLVMPTGLPAALTPYHPVDWQFFVLIFGTHSTVRHFVGCAGAVLHCHHSAAVTDW